MHVTGRTAAGRRSAGWSLMVVLCGIACASAQEPEVHVELSSPSVFVGESVRYLVTLQYCEDTVRPTLAEVPDMHIYEAGVTVVRQRMFDGRRSVSVGGPRIEYVLTPQGPGTFTIPGPTIHVAGRVYRGEPKQLQVSAPQPQDLVDLELTVPRSVVYLGQPFDLQLSVFLRCLPDPLGDEEPLGALQELPRLTLSWADDSNLPAGVRANVPAEKWLSEMLSDTRRPQGFTINQLRVRSRDLFSVFDRGEAAVFRPVPQRVRRANRHGRPTDYWQYTFQRRLEATREGPVRFGPASFKGSLVERVTSDQQRQFTQVYTVAEPLTVDVRDAPAAGRPKTYLGVLGPLEVVSRLTTSEVQVGEPITLEVTLSGPNVDRAITPNLEEFPAIARQFKVYDVQERTESGRRVLQYGMRVKSADVTEFPAWDYAYFDWDQEQFVQGRTSPLHLKVAATDRLEVSEIAWQSASEGLNGRRQVVTEGLFANMSDLSQVRDEGVRGEHWGSALLVVLLVYGGGTAAIKLVRRRRPASMRGRLKLACALNAAALEMARQAQRNGRHREVADHLYEAVARPVATMEMVAHDRLTSRDVEQLLTTAGIAEQQKGQIRRWLEEFEAVRYGQAPPVVLNDFQEIEVLVRALLEQLALRKRTR